MSTPGSPASHASPGADRHALGPAALPYLHFIFVVASYSFPTLNILPIHTTRVSRDSLATMIDPTTAIEVIVKPMNSARSSEPYHEWKASHKGDQVGVAPNECYIEAVDGERFQIEVVLHPLFSFHGAPEVKIRCRIDGGAAAIDTIMKRPSEWSKSSTAMRTSFDFYYSTVAGFSRKCGFGFSKLAVCTWL
jgi:hypothetical protein